MSHRGSARAVPYAGVQCSEATGWVAWVLLAGLLLVLLGALHLVTGLVALLRPEILALSRADLLLPVGPAVLGWAHVVLGAVAAVVGVGPILGRRWARVIGILLACLAAVVNFAFADVYPLWSATAVVLTAIVIFAVAAHGSEVADAYGSA